MGIRALRQLAEEQRQVHYSAEPDKSDPYWTPDGRLVYDWLQTLPRKGSAPARKLYLHFLRWASVEEEIFTETRWGRMMLPRVVKRRTNGGIVYEGISLP